MSTTTAATATPAPAELIPLREFLRRHSVSKSAFYRMASAGAAPDIVKLGRGTFVPVEAARRWLAARIVPATTIATSSQAALAAKASRAARAARPAIEISRAGGAA